MMHEQPSQTAKNAHRADGNCRILLFGESHNSTKDIETLKPMLRESLDAFKSRNPVLFIEIIDRPHNRNLLADLQEGNISKLAVTSRWPAQLKTRLEAFKAEGIPVVPIDLPDRRQHRMEEAYFYRLVRDAYMSHAIDSHIEENDVDLALVLTGAVHVMPLEAGLRGMGHRNICVDFLNNNEELSEYTKQEGVSSLSPLRRGTNRNKAK